MDTMFSSRGIVLTYTLGLICVVFLSWILTVFIFINFGYTLKLMHVKKGS